MNLAQTLELYAGGTKEGARKVCETKKSKGLVKKCGPGGGAPTATPTRRGKRAKPPNIERAKLSLFERMSRDTMSMRSREGRNLKKKMAKLLQQGTGRKFKVDKNDIYELSRKDRDLSVLGLVPRHSRGANLGYGVIAIVNKEQPLFTRSRKAVTNPGVEGEFEFRGIVFKAGNRRQAIRVASHMENLVRKKKLPKVTKIKRLPWYLRVA